MLSREEQMKEWDRVVAMCKGTKFEGREYLCVKYWDDTTWTTYSHHERLLLPEIIRSRIFAVAIVDDTPIWLEEPFILYQTNTNLEYSYRKQDNKLVGVYRDSNNCRVLTAIIPMENVRWEYFTLTKPSKCTESIPVSLEHPEVFLQGKIAGTKAKVYSNKHSHYYKDVSNLDKIDVYRLIQLYEITDPCLQHVLKKLLVTGNRGHKDFKTDITNMIDTLTRKLEMMEEGK